ncbi:hypothetical protein ACHWQZ_G012216 [Mnemiopsis leidyi]
MALWVDKHRPKSLSQLDYHKPLAQHLKKLVNSGDFPHLLVYGPSGAGKKTRIMCLLREIYGAGVEKLRIEHHSFNTPSNKKIEISTIASNYHIMVNPSDAGIYDRVVIQDLIKTIAQTNQLDSEKMREFKVVVLTDADRLTKDAQHALRRTMEKYMSKCRVIMCTNSISKMIPAIRSRCLGIRISAPNQEEMTSVLNLTCRKEGINLPPELAERIIAQSERNMRRALLMCETCKVQQYPLSPDQTVDDPDWMTFVKQTAMKIIEEQSPKRLLDIRSRLYELLAHCIPPETIFRTLADELVKHCDGTLQKKVIQAAANYEHKLQLGSRPIYYLEAFVARFMAMYKGFIQDAIMDFDDFDFDES